MGFGGFFEKGKLTCRRLDLRPFFKGVEHLLGAINSSFWQASETCDMNPIAFIGIATLDFAQKRDFILGLVNGDIVVDRTWNFFLERC